MINSKTIVVFDWDDIKTEICQKMNIQEEYFRDYHKLIGGEYKDLWHEWLRYFDEVSNDIIKYNDLGENMESKLEWVKEDGKEWMNEFIEAVYAVWNENNIKYVKYCW